MKVLSRDTKKIERIKVEVELVLEDGEPADELTAVLVYFLPKEVESQEIEDECDENRMEGIDE